MGFADERTVGLVGPCGRLRSAMSFPRQSYSGLGGPLLTSDSARGLRHPVHLTARLTVVVVGRCELLEEAALQTRTMLETGRPTWVTWVLAVSLSDPATGCLSELRRRLPRRLRICSL